MTSFASPSLIFLFRSGSQAFPWGTSINHSELSRFINLTLFLRILSFLLKLQGVYLELLIFQIFHFLSFFLTISAGFGVLFCLSLVEFEKFLNGFGAYLRPIRLSFNILNSLKNYIFSFFALLIASEATKKLRAKQSKNICHFFAWGLNFSTCAPAN